MVIFASWRLRSLLLSSCSSLEKESPLSNHLKRQFLILIALAWVSFFSNFVDWNGDGVVIWNIKQRQQKKNKNCLSYSPSSGLKVRYNFNHCKKIPWKYPVIICLEFVKIVLSLGFLSTFQIKIVRKLIKNNREGKITGYCTRSRCNINWTAYDG